MAHLIQIFCSYVRSYVQKTGLFPFRLLYKKNVLFKGKSCQVILFAIILVKLCLNFQNSQPKDWANACIWEGLGVHPLNLGQFSKTHAFSLDTGFHNFSLKELVNPWLNHGVPTVIQCEPSVFDGTLKVGFHWHDGPGGGWKWLMQGSMLYYNITACVAESIRAFIRNL